MCGHSAVRHKCFQPSDSHAQPGHAGAETSASGREDSGGLWREQIIAEGSSTEGEQEQGEGSGQWRCEGASQIESSLSDSAGNSRRSMKLFRVH